MRDGEGNRLSPEEQARVKSIQGDPGTQATTQVSIEPHPNKATGDADKPEVHPKDKPSAGVGQS